MHIKDEIDGYLEMIKRGIEIKSASNVLNSQAENERFKELYGIYEIQYKTMMRMMGNSEVIDDDTKKALKYRAYYNSRDPRVFQGEKDRWLSLTLPKENTGS